MKWVFVALICCGGLLLLILIGANIGLILGVILNNWIIKIDVVLEIVFIC